MGHDDDDNIKHKWNVQQSQYLPLTRR